MAGIDSYVKLLVRGGGDDASTSFSDISPNYRTLTTSGVYVRHLTAVTKFQSSSIGMSPKNSSYFYAASHTDFEFGTGNFTIDFWIRPSSLGYTVSILSRAWIIWQLTSGKIQFEDYYAGFSLTSTNALSTGTWYHIALVRNGTTFTLYIDGVANGTITSSNASTSSSSTLDVGPKVNSSYTISAYIDEIRISKGIARWTAAFTPPTSAYTSPEFAMTGSGGAVTGGSATVLTTFSLTASGGALAGGASDYHYSVERLIASGGALCGGSSLFHISQLAMSAGGGAVIGGVAGVQTTLIIIASAGAVCSGAIDIIQYLHIQPIRHYKCESITDYVTPNSIHGGDGLAAISVVAGKFNNAVSDGGVLLPNDSNHAFKGFSLWLRRYNLGYFSRIAGNSSDSTYLDISVNGTVIFGSTYIDTGADITDTEWHHICLTEGSTTAKVKLFIDGLKIGSEFDSDWSAGIYRVGTYCNLDNVQIYDRILTEEEVSYLFFQENDDIPFPMAFAGIGGAICGGEAPWAFPLSFVGDGGALVGGSATSKLCWISPPTQHWTFDDITFEGVVGIVENEIVDGKRLHYSNKPRVTGKFGLALSGGNSTAPFPTLSSYSPVPFQAISMWIKREVSSYHSFLLMELFGTQGVLLNGSTNYLGSFDENENIYYTDLQISDLEEWHHLCIVRGSDSAHHYYYLDGVRSSDEIQTDVGDFSYLSYSASNSTYRNPSIDNVQVYSRPFSQEDVNYLFSAISDETTLPRLPELIPAVNGGAVTGGEAVTRMMPMIVETVGGSVAGGSAEYESGFCILTWVEGIAPDSYGDIVLNHVALAVVSGVAPESYGDIVCAGMVDGTFPDSYGDIQTHVKISADLEGVSPDTTGDIRSIATMLVSVSGMFPDCYGSISINHTDFCSFDGAFPDSYGNITAIARYFVEVSGVWPDSYGSIVADAGTGTDDILGFPGHVAGNYGTVVPEESFNVLSFTRNLPNYAGLVVIAGVSPDSYGDIH